MWSGEDIASSCAQVWQRLFIRRAEITGTEFTIKVREQNGQVFDELYVEFSRKLARSVELRNKLILQSLGNEELGELDCLRIEIPGLEKKLAGLLVAEDSDSQNMVVYVNGVWPARVRRERAEEFLSNEMQIDLFSRQIDTWKHGPALTEHLTRAQQSRILNNALNKRKSLISSMQNQSESFYNELNQRVVDIENVVFVRLPVVQIDNACVKDEVMLNDGSNKYSRDIEGGCEIADSNKDLNIYGYRNDTRGLILSKLNGDSGG